MKVFELEIYMKNDLSHTVIVHTSSIEAKKKVPITDHVCRDYDVSGTVKKLYKLKQMSVNKIKTKYFLVGTF
jgi:hypothetical protein